MLQVKDAIAAFAVNELAALELLEQRRTDAGTAGAARIAVHDLCYGDVLPLLQPYDKSDLEMYAVSRAVNNAANDSPDCIQPAEPFDSSTDKSDSSPQQTLFDFI